MSPPPARILALGAVQLGQAYGISRADDALPDGESILATAEDAGIELVDTAAHYGCSEAVIGRYLGRHPKSPLTIVSKLHPQGDTSSPQAVFEQVERSCARIGRPLAAILLHNSAQLREWDGVLGEGLSRARDAGLASILGVSVYTPDQFAEALAIPDIGMIQAPMNVLDRRLAERGLVGEAAARGVEIVIRSAYLQGLLLMRPEELPAHMTFAAPAIAGFDAVCTGAGVSRQAVALAAIRRLAPHARIVVGCHSAEQLIENLRALQQPPPDWCIDAALALPQGEERLVNPSLWQESR